MRTNNDIIVNGEDASASITSEPYSLQNMIGFSITASFVGGTPAGTIKLQISNDRADNGAPPSTWVDLLKPTDSSTAISAAGNVVWNYQNAFYRWVRVVWTRTGGSSTLTVTANAKGF